MNNAVLVAVSVSPFLNMTFGFIVVEILSVLYLTLRMSCYFSPLV
ncbi:hypothetical protein DSUL_50176 [Desulfovibrionales bacterium]